MLHNRMHNPGRAGRELYTPILCVFAVLTTPADGRNSMIAIFRQVLSNRTSLYLFLVAFLPVIGLSLVTLACQPACLQKTVGEPESVSNPQGGRNWVPVVRAMSRRTMAEMNTG